MIPLVYCQKIKSKQAFTPENVISRLLATGYMLQQNHESRPASDKILVPFSTRNPFEDTMF